jgi:hypothetical protein
MHEDPVKTMDFIKSTINGIYGLSFMNKCLLK